MATATLVSPEVSAAPRITQPTPKQIDALCAKYEAALAEADSAAGILKDKSAAAGALKASLIELTQVFGFRHTEKSNRLVGIHSFAQTTTATRVETVSAAVDAFKAYLESSHSPALIGRFFKAHTTYSLIAGPAEVLASLELPTRIRTKMKSLIDACFTIKTSSPSLKVETVTAAKP